MHPNWIKKIYKVSRFIHVYCSTSLCILLIFFSVTGITLNHQWYGNSISKPQHVQETILKNLLSSWVEVDTDSNDWQADITAIQNYLTQNYNLPSPSSIELDQELWEIAFEYQVPSGYATALINVQTGQLNMVIESGSALGIINDLHKGRHSGPVWSWLIDISAVIMILFSLTGMIIVYQGSKYKRNGSIAMALGLLLPSVLYYLFVPSI